MSLRQFWWLLGFLLVAAAVYICLAPSDDIPKPFNISDKASHVVGHAALSAYFAGLVARRSWWKIFAGLLLLGVAIEFAQEFMRLGRHGDLRDVLANGLGDALGLLLAWLGLARWPAWAESLLGRRVTP